MEFFIPSIFIFLVAIGTSFALAPRLTPIVVAILSIGLLVFAVYSHYKMFAAEYRLSTWQDSLKIYAPALMIGAIIIFIIYSIIALFSKGEVPVPQVPSVNMPPANTATNKVTETINNTTESIGNMFNNLKGSVNENVLNKFNLTGNTTNKRNNNNINKSNMYKNQLTRSFLETI